MQWGWVWRDRGCKNEGERGKVCEAKCGDSKGGTREKWTKMRKGGRYMKGYSCCTVRKIEWTKGRLAEVKHWEMGMVGRVRRGRE